MPYYSISSLCVLYYVLVIVGLGLYSYNIGFVEFLLVANMYKTLYRYMNNKGIPTYTYVYTLFNKRKLF